MFIEIDSKKIGGKFPPYIVAELSANHHGSIGNALQLIAAAKKAGADAVKIQTYTPDTITIDCASNDFKIDEGLWSGKTLYQLYGEAYTPWEWHAELFEFARSLGLSMFSSPFDKSAVDLLMDLNVPAFKIASFELVDLPLIRYVAATKKPVIMSTGMASLDEIGEAIQAARDGGCSQLLVLHCISGYPAVPDEYNLEAIRKIKEQFQVLVGLSDHTITNTTAISAVAMGACFIEKHFTLDRNSGGPDDAFSVEPPQMSSLCTDCRIAWQARGDGCFGRAKSEMVNKKFRRSLYVVKPIKQGEYFTEDNVRSIRPGFGCEPKHLPYILGKKSKCDLEFGTPMRMEYLHD